MRICHFGPFSFTAVWPRWLIHLRTGWERVGRENVILSCSTAQGAEALVETDTGGLNGVGEE